MLEIETDVNGKIKNVVKLGYIQTEEDLYLRLNQKIDIERHSLVVDKRMFYNGKGLDEVRAYQDRVGGYVIYTEDRDDIEPGFLIDIVSLFDVKNAREVVVMDGNRKPMKMSYNEEDLENFNKNTLYKHEII